MCLKLQVKLSLDRIVRFTTWPLKAAVELIPNLPWCVCSTCSLQESTCSFLLRMYPSHPTIISRWNQTLTFLYNLWNKTTSPLPNHLTSDTANTERKYSKNTDDKLFLTLYGFKTRGGLVKTTIMQGALHLHKKGNVISQEFGVQLGQF